MLGILAKMTKLHKIGKRVFKAERLILNNRSGREYQERQCGGKFNPDKSSSPMIYAPGPKKLTELAPVSTLDQVK